MSEHCAEENIWAKEGGSKMRQEKNYIMRRFISCALHLILDKSNEGHVTHM
jgi:hypothetical protein